MTNIVPYFHICLNLMDVYIDIKDKILANIRVIVNNLFFVLKLCRQFILAFQALQTIFFQISHSPPPPSRKLMVRPLLIIQSISVFKLFCIAVLPSPLVEDIQSYLGAF